MKLTISTPDGDIFTLDVPSDMVLSGLKVLISADCGLSEHQFMMMKDGQLISGSNQTLQSAGFSDGDLVALIPSSASRPRPPVTGAPGVAPSGTPQLDFSSVRLPGFTTPTTQGNAEAESVRLLLKNTPHLLEPLRQRNPDLAAAIDSPAEFTRLYTAFRGSQRQWQGMSSADPLDPAVQGQIAEMIRQQNIGSNMETALEHYPETFGQVSMLFVDCQVGDHHVKAFVDSGAQSTIVSERCAERCNIRHLIDKKWAGMAYGVGTQTIIGRVHFCEISIGGVSLPTSFMVLKDQHMDMLIGLDMLKRHLCCIDLKRNVLLLDSGRVETPFLPESEIPSMHPAEQMSTDDASTSSSQQQAAMDQLTSDQRTKVNQLISQGVPMTRAITELESHGWDVQTALVSFMSSDDAPP